ncbi:sterol homeostasis protein [Blastocladiella emersonii ATCC 22665]|nr:sterol homeostasis protein [Blastocladiella emersonii ATCC 22665]
MESACTPTTVCIECGAPVDRLFTEYSPGNIRLEQCPACSAFADAYLERDAVLVFVDVLLHRAPAFRHVLFNRAHRSRGGDAGDAAASKVPRLAVLLTLFDVYARLLRMERAGRAGAYATAWANLTLVPRSGAGGGWWTGWVGPAEVLMPLLPPQLRVIREVLREYVDVLSTTVLEFAVFFAIVALGLRLARARTTWRSAFDAVAMSTFGRLLLIVVVIWDPARLAPANVAYIWLINAYVAASNAEALRALTGLPYIGLLVLVAAGNLVAHLAVSSVVAAR